MRILFWFRKDLRLDDNTGLWQASHDADHVVPFYASEPQVLGHPDIAPARVRFVLESLADLDDAVRRAGSGLVLDHGPATETVLRAARAVEADAVYWNDEYEPSLLARDEQVERALRAAGIGVRRFHDRLLVAPGAVHTASGGPFVVYTPFRGACERLPFPEPVPKVERLAAHALPLRPLATLDQLGFTTEVRVWPGGARAAHRRLRRFVGGTGERPGGGLALYATHRDSPAIPATSRLSADLKFGTLSPRQIARNLRDAAASDRRLRASVEKYLAELRWRDFYAHVMFHFPHSEHGAFRREYDALRWANDPEPIEAWRAGRTGYPIVDAGMRELAATGFMHNRVRMITASFLVKDLHVDWRIGEQHFMRHLIDGDLASNNGGWQWSASTGTDAQPYFRVFNPVLQGQKYDPEGAYVRQWVPELARLSARFVHAPWQAPARALEEARVVLGTTYPMPIVDHAEARVRAIAMFRSLRGGPTAGA
jgi:deoxyribodipyrimidine photo-lyase